MSQPASGPAAGTNNRALFLASFMTLIAAGMGFAIRSGVLADWAAQFGFTNTELGQITGGGLVGFGITIIACSLFIDRIGYKPLMVLAFLLHVLSLVVTLAATPIYERLGKDATYACLYWGMFMFALANGMCEAVINPLVATLYSRQKTHYLNILHAGWPGGLILGGLLGFLFVGNGATLTHLRWEIPISFFILPTLIYGFIILKERFPISEARAAGVSFGTMLAQFASPILLLLLLLHAMVGYVELGTDSWTTNIMEVVTSGNGILVLVYTSGIMFVLRFFAGPIVEKINPVGLLLVSSVIGCIGLYWLGSVETDVVSSGVDVAGGTLFMVFLAATVYGFGKAFLWPTMLGVVGERFPRGGALAMGAMGGVGMLSAGLLGGPGIGYTQDYYASSSLQEAAPEVYEEYAAADSNRFLVFPPVRGLDGHKVGQIEDKLFGPEQLTDVQTTVMNAELYGGRMALKVTAIIPFCMAIGYLILVIYFRAKGGYKQELLHGHPAEGEEWTGGVEGPVR